jgi:hypothetical protein
VQLAVSDVPKEPFPSEESWMFAGVSTHRDLRCHVFIEPHLTKDASLGTHFEKVFPKNGNQFELELGVILPDLFPNLDGKPEYRLEVFDGKTTKALCFSNVMARLRYLKENDMHHAIISRGALHQVQSGGIEFIPKDAGVEYLRTFSTSRFEITGSTAEEAFETHVEECIHDFIERLNRCLKAMPFVDPAAGCVYSTVYSRANLSYFYFIVKGDPESELGHGWIAPHLGRTTMNPTPLAADKAEVLRDYLSGKTAINDIDSLLYSAKTFLDGGVTEYVLLLSVIAAEVATQRYVQKKLLEASITAKKLEEKGKDLTYSLMLNILLVALAPEDKKPDKTLIGSMNRARSLRNDYMHNGELPKDPKEINNIYDNTKVFVQYLREVD